MKLKSYISGILNYFKGNEAYYKEKLYEFKRYLGISKKKSLNLKNFAVKCNLTVYYYSKCNNMQ